MTTRQNKYRCSRTFPNNFRLQIITKTKHFCWWNVFEDMCKMGRWSFWSWFDVKKTIFTFSFSVTLTFDL